MVKRTCLYEAHRAAGARMVEFAGWEMPLQYTGIVAEHHAVRNAAGLFDVSHMGEVELRGSRALAAAQRITTNDLSRLRDGQAQYSVMCAPDGGVIDDVIVYRWNEQRLMICVNAGNRDSDYDWIAAHASGTEVLDRGDELAQLAVQGPRATAILQHLTRTVLDRIPPFYFVEDRVAGRPATMARTGYTGEDGWEIYCAAGDAASLWAALLAEGNGAGLRPAGLGARDTLRLEAALPLYGHELSRDITPLQARLAWVVRFEKPDFIGRAALAAEKQRGMTRRLVGLMVQNGGIARQGYAVMSGTEVVGTVTSGTKSPSLGRAVALAFVASEHAKIGTSLAVEIRGRAVATEVVPLPFYRRTQTSA